MEYNSFDHTPCDVPTEDNTKNAGNNIKRKIVACSCIVFVLCLPMILSAAAKHSEYSADENRPLAQFPAISAQSLFNGSYTAGISDYFSDHFVRRSNIIALKSKLEILSGKKENNNIFVGKNGSLIENSAALYAKQNVAGIIAGNIEGINALAKHPYYNVKVAVVPDAFEIMRKQLPENTYKSVYWSTYKQLKSKLSSKVKLIECSGLLLNHNKEYIYYRTDHHQTALGSYYLYAALGGTLGYKAYPKTDFKIKNVNADFRGSLWSKSGFIKVSPDIISTYTLTPKPYKCTVTFPGEQDKTMSSLYNPSRLFQKNKYDYYLDGNHTVTVITSSCGTNSKIAILKDSFAHSLVPFLVNHYSEIHLIDMRYYNKDIYQYLENSGIEDILILYGQNTFIADTNLAKLNMNSGTSANIPAGIECVVPKSMPVDDSYFSDAVFIGDSLTLGLGRFSGIKAHFMAIGGVGTSNIFSKTLSNGRKITEELKRMPHVGKIYIMLGANELAVIKTPQSYIERYKKVIDTVRQYHPSAIIYIESIMPVTKAKSATSKFNNQKVNACNKELRKLAKEKRCYYVDLHSAIADSEGALPAGVATKDGVHLNNANEYKKLAAYLRTHTIASGSKKQNTSVKVQGIPSSPDAEKIVEKIMTKIAFQDSLGIVDNSLILSEYKLEQSDIAAAALCLGSGGTAEEIAVFKAKDAAGVKKLKISIQEHIEKRKRDFAGYRPMELKKLNNPIVVSDGNCIVVCIADNVDEKTIKDCINSK